MSGQVWCFDLDGTLVDSFAAEHLRPFASDLLALLRQRGVEVHIWSAGGAEYAARVAERVGIAALVCGFHEKERVAGGRWAMPPFPSGVEIVFVDDQVDGVPDGHRVVPVFPYLGRHRHDAALRPLVDEVTAARRFT